MWCLRCRMPLWRHPHGARGPLTPHAVRCGAMLQNRRMFAWHTLVPLIAVGVRRRPPGAARRGGGGSGGGGKGRGRGRRGGPRGGGGPGGGGPRGCAGGGVTIIEVALIFSVMLGGGPDKATLPRDTIFAAIMIICNGVVGICVLVGGLRHREQFFRIEGTGPGPGRPGGHGHTVAGVADLHHQFARRHLHHGAAGLSGHQFAGAVGGRRPAHRAATRRRPGPPAPDRGRPGGGVGGGGGQVPRPTTRPGPASPQGGGGGWAGGAGTAAANRQQTA